MKKQEEYKELSDKDLSERLDAEVIALNQLRINVITKDFDRPRGFIHE